jgi:hypothetical protein
MYYFGYQRNKGSRIAVEGENLGTEGCAVARMVRSLFQKIITTWHILAIIVFKGVAFHFAIMPCLCSLVSKWDLITSEISHMISNNVVDRPIWGRGCPRMDFNPWAQGCICLLNDFIRMWLHLCQKTSKSSARLGQYCATILDHWHFLARGHND